MNKEFDFVILEMVGGDNVNRSVAGKIKLAVDTTWDYINAPFIVAIVQCLVLIVGVIGYGFYDGQNQKENLRYQRRLIAAERVAKDMVVSLAALMEFKRNMVYVNNNDLKAVSYEKKLDSYRHYRDTYHRQPCDSVLFSVKAAVGDCLDYKSANGETIGELIERIKGNVSMLESMKLESVGEDRFSIKNLNGEVVRLAKHEAMDEIDCRVDGINDDIEKLTLLIQEVADKKWSIWR